eukprot:2090729-Prymnesium_polylepis.2
MQTQHCVARRAAQQQQRALQRAIAQGRSLSARTLEAWRATPRTADRSGALLMLQSEPQQSWRFARSTLTERNRSSARCPSSHALRPRPSRKLASAGLRPSPPCCSLPPCPSRPMRLLASAPTATWCFAFAPPPARSRFAMLSPRRYPGPCHLRHHRPGPCLRGPL